MTTAEAIQARKRLDEEFERIQAKGSQATSAEKIQWVMIVFHAADPDLADTIVRGITIYATGTETQKQIMNQIQTGHHTWAEILDIVDQAELAAD